MLPCLREALGETFTEAAIKNTGEQTKCTPCKYDL